MNQSYSYWADWAVCLGLLEDVLNAFKRVWWELAKPPLHNSNSLGPLESVRVIGISSYGEIEL